MTCAVFSTSLREPTTGSWRSAVWSAPAAEDFVRTRRCSATSEREPHKLSEGSVWDYSGVLTWCVSEVVCREIFPQGFNSVCTILQQWFSVSHLTDGDIFSVSCTSDGNMDALRCWWSRFDVHLPRHLGPVISSRVQVHVSRWICRISPGYVPVFIQKSSVSQVYIWLL